MKFACCVVVAGLTDKNETIGMAVLIGGHWDKPSINDAAGRKTVEVSYDGLCKTGEITTEHASWDYCKDPTQRCNTTIRCGKRDIWSYHDVTPAEGPLSCAMSSVPNIKFNEGANWCYCKGADPIYMGYYLKDWWHKNSRVNQLPVFCTIPGELSSEPGGLNECAEDIPQRHKSMPYNRLADPNPLVGQISGLGTSVNFSDVQAEIAEWDDGGWGGWRGGASGPDSDEKPRTYGRNVYSALGFSATGGKRGAVCECPDGEAFMIEASATKHACTRGGGWKDHSKCFADSCVNGQISEFVEKLGVGNGEGMRVECNYTGPYYAGGGLGTLCRHSYVPSAADLNGSFPVKYYKDDTHCKFWERTTVTYDTNVYPEWTTSTTSIPVSIPTPIVGLSDQVIGDLHETRRRRMQGVQSQSPRNQRGEVPFSTTHENDASAAVSNWSRATGMLVEFGGITVENETKVSWSSRMI